jgi:20S proteasome alpha/beta subunit
VVFCTDKRVESEIGSAETEEKIRWLSPRWYVLAAGPLDEVQELIEIYRSHLDRVSIATGSVLEELRIPPRLLRKRMAEALIHQRVALSYEEFLEVGKDKLQDDVYRQLSYDMTVQRIEAELLLVGYVPLPRTKDLSHFEAYLCRSGDIFSRQHFAAIGSGAAVAESALYQRQQNKNSSLSDTLYCVYEAKRLGENVPGVGKETRLAVWCINDGDDLDRPFRNWHELNAGALRFLEQQFQEYGPKRLDGLHIDITELLGPSYEAFMKGGKLC